MTAGQNILFDLDGTLVDSLPGIEMSARIAIEQVMPGTAIPNLRAVIGPPIAVMFRRIWPHLPEVDLTELVQAFRIHYDDEGCLLSEPYPDVARLLAELAADGRKLFILTNKPAAPTRRLLAHLDLSDHFHFIASPDIQSPSFPDKPALARHLAARFALAADATLVVGDGADDAAAATACGFHFIPAHYGYGKPGTMAGLSHFAELEDLLNFTLLRP